MADHDYHWENNEANFGPPITDQVEGGTHITFEIVLRLDGEFVALRRPDGIPGHHEPPEAEEHPDGLLYFCHNLIRYGESLEECVSRIVRSQAGVAVDAVDVVDLESVVHENQDNWGIIPHVIVDLSELPEAGLHGNQVTEIVTFTPEDVPDDFAWWPPEQLQEFLQAHG